GGADGVEQLGGARRALLGAHHVILAAEGQVQPLADAELLVAELPGEHREPLRRDSAPDDDEPTHASTVSRLPQPEHPDQDPHRDEQAGARRGLALELAVLAHAAPRELEAAPDPPGQPPARPERPPPSPPVLP